jgi:hypothetical protein
VSPFNLEALARDHEVSLARQLLRSALIREAKEQRPPRRRVFWRAHRRSTRRTVDLGAGAEIVAYRASPPALPPPLCDCEVGAGVRSA